MSPSRTFILKPVATSLMMAGVVLVGVVAFRQLPVSALPQVDYPTMQIQTFYPGASPEVVTSSITAPLEKQLGQVPGLQQMTSISSFGSSLITLQFSLDLSIDVAEQEVQAAINAATTFLPTNLPVPPIYSKTNPADAPILTLAITSSTVPLPKVEELAETRMAQRISQLKGVGLVSISGGQRPAVRVQANPTALASYDLSMETLRTALASANVNQAKGNFDGPDQAWTINDNDQLQAGAQYGPIIIAYRNGAPVRISDVARVIDGAENTKLAAWVNEDRAIVLNIQRQPGTNMWILLAAVPSSLLAGTTTRITTNIAAGPLFWVIPLAVYLLSFVLAFARRRILPLRLALWLQVAALVPLAAGAFGVELLGPWQMVGATVALLFLSAYICDVRLVDSRPGPDRITEFYFMIALGGLLGGAFNALVAPNIFKDVTEYPLALILAVALRPPSGATQQNGYGRDLLLPLAAGIAAAVVLLASPSEKIGTNIHALGFILGLGLVGMATAPIRFAAGLAVAFVQ